MLQLRPVRSQALVHADSRHGGGFIPLDTSNRTECPKARSEFTEKYVGRIRAVSNTCFVGRHNKDPLHVGGWLSATAPSRVPLARLCPAGFRVNRVGLLAAGLPAEARVSLPSCSSQEGWVC